MGWTGVYRWSMTSKEKKEYLDRLYTSDNHAVIKSAIVGTTYYCAVRMNSGEVVAGICLTHMHRDGEFRYKDMCEDEGPYSYDCPIGILNLLTPTKEEYAINWRKKCYERHRELTLQRNAKKSLQAYAIYFRCYNCFLKKTTSAHIFYGNTPQVFATQELAEKQISGFCDNIKILRTPIVVKIKRDSLDSKWVIDESYSN